MKKDMREAVRLYRLAADQRYALAQARLGFVFKFTLDFRADYQKAPELFRAAALQGHSLSQHSVGNCYRDGEGFETNEMMAACFYCVASKDLKYSVVLKHNHIDLSPVCLFDLV